MSVPPRPDILSAVLDRLRANTDLAALTNTAAGWKDGGSGIRIAGSIQPKWKMPTKAVIVRPRGGPIDFEKRSVGLLKSRMDVFCYGESSYEAQRLWRTLDPVLCPDQSRLSFFKLNGCRVVGITAEREYDTDVEPDSGWHRAMYSVLVDWFAL